MKAVKVVPFDVKHLGFMDLREVDKNIVNYLNKIEGVSADGLAYTLFVDGDIICCSGVNNLWAGTGEAWVIGSKKFKENGRLIVRLIRKFLDWVQPELYHRIQMTVRSDFPEAVRLAEFLGFKREGVLEKYSMDKTDFYMYARVM